MTKEQFIEKYCRECGSQRCEGPSSEWFSGCRVKNELKEDQKNGDK